VSAVLALLAPADAVRAALLRLLAPWLGALYGQRERRVMWWGVGLSSLAFAVTLTVPLWSLALAPLLFGVPHLLSDVRYLVVRPGLHRRHLVWLAAPLLVATSFGAPPWVGLLAQVPAVLGARGTLTRTAPLLLAAAGLVALSLWRPVGFQLVFLHVHNALAVALWWWWRPRGGRAWVVLAAVVGFSALLLLGAAEPVLSALGTWTAPRSGTSFEEFVAFTTPLSDPTWAVRFVLLFAFLQSVHYSMWLRLVPEDDRPRAAPRPFRATWESLTRDFGTWPLLLVAALAAGLAAWGAVNLYDARLGYLRLAAFHGYLELAAVGYLLALGRRPVEEARA